MPVPRALLMMARRAPVIPPALYGQLLAILRAAPEPELLTALLARTDVPLADLAPLCTPTAEQDPKVAAAYLSRREHGPADLEALLDADGRPEVLEALFKQRYPGPAAVRAAVDRCDDVVTLGVLVRSRGVPAELAASALARAARLLRKTGGGSPTRSDVGPRRHTPAEAFEKMLVAVARDAALADAVVPLTRDRRVLPRAARAVENPAAADAVARRWLKPLLTGTPEAEELREAYDYTARLTGWCTPAARAQLADWWERAVIPADRRGRPALDAWEVADRVAQLRSGSLLDRPWRAALREDYPWTAGAVELAALLAAELGDDDARWVAFTGLSVEFTGTVGELIAAVHGVTAAPATAAD